MARQVSERSIVFLVGAVQFVNILDFLIVMPLGPDFARALDIPTSHLGYVGGSYTAAAAIAGLAGSLFLDRFDRRKALGVAMAGLVLGTAAGAFARGMTSLMAARLLAGAFGGPATSLSLSIVADVVPPERRGKAMGAVMSAFSVASVFGVPIGLELARLTTWRLPFLATAALGAVVTACAVFMLPPLRLHLEETTRAAPSFAALFSRRIVLLSYTMTAVVMMGGFILIPNISTFLQLNLDYPREHLGRLYLAGGAINFVALRLVGRLVDRYGSFRVGTAGTGALLIVLYFGFFAPVLPVMVLFTTFMLAMSIRNVSYNTLASKVPRSRERARFMSIQSAVQHFAAAAGSFLSAKMLHELPDRRLEGMERIAAVSMALTLVLPALLWLVEAQLDEKRPIADPLG